MKIKVFDDVMPLVRAFVDSLPPLAREKVISIDGVESTGNGQTTPKGEVHLGFTLNPVYDLELLGHEFGHAQDDSYLIKHLGLGRFSALGINGLDCRQASLFSCYALYGEKMRTLGSTERERKYNNADFLRLAVMFEDGRKNLDKLHTAIQDYRKKNRRNDVRHYLHPSMVPFEI